MIPQTRQELVSLFQASIDMDDAAPTLGEAIEEAIDRLELAELRFYAMHDYETARWMEDTANRLRAAMGGKQNACISERS